MRFSLQDVKKQVRRREGELTVSLHFLRPGELRAEIDNLVAYFEQQRGQARKQFALDEAHARVGDYRLANCLIATLNAWYIWQQPAWSDLLQTLSAEANTTLAAEGIVSPVHLRLALFDYVNAHYSGFLSTQERPDAIATFATLYGLETSQMAYLLALDSEEEAVLTRVSPVMPTAEDVAARYNQGVFEAALYNSSEAHFLIDCPAFLAAQQQSETSMIATSIGSVIKRLCFLARKLGVYYDLAYERDLTGQNTTLLHLTLYGPQEMTGIPQQYGLRLARLCRILLGYGISTHSTRPAQKRQASLALAKAIRHAEATVHFFQKAYRFWMEGELLTLLPPPEQEGATPESARVAESAHLYDSSIEQSFAEAFASLARSQGADGWQLEREPEPLLLSTGAGELLAQGIFIPDFALTRGPRRVYVEILGFWTPAYRERKIQKLRQLRGRDDLVLAIPVEARAAFAGLAADFPLVEYTNQLSATDLLQVMRNRYDDFAQRVAALDVAHVRASIRTACFVPERACYELLHCYRRSELPLAAASVLTEDMVFMPGLGLYLVDWLEHLRRSFVEEIGTLEHMGQTDVPLVESIATWQKRWPELATCDAGTVEALISLWPEVHIRRSSIFEARLVLATGSEPDQDADNADQPISEGNPATRKVARERRTARRKRVNEQPPASQQNLWE